METTEGGERQAKGDSEGRVAGEWDGVEKGEWKEGELEKSKGWSGAFSPNHILYPQSGFHPASHQQPGLRNTSANATHTKTHNHHAKKLPLTVITSLPFGIVQNLFMYFVATGNCLKRIIEHLERFPVIIAKMSLRSQLKLKPFQRGTQSKNRMISFPFVLQEIKRLLTKLS